MLKDALAENISIWWIQGKFGINKWFVPNDIITKIQKSCGYYDKVKLHHIMNNLNQKVRYFPKCK